MTGQEHETTADELVGRIFAAQERLDADSDPGDLHISVQDDMPLAVVSQNRDPWKPFYGRTIVEALTKAAEHYEAAVSGE